MDVAEGEVLVIAVHQVLVNQPLLDVLIDLSNIKMGKLLLMELS